MNKLRIKKGITLIALVITIIILLILAGVTIGSINSGLFDYAKKAKTDTQEATAIEGIENSYIIAKGNSRSGRITVSDMQNGLDIVFGANGAEAIDNGDTIVVRIDDQYYEIDNSGHIGTGQTLEVNSNPGDITKGGTCTGTESNPYRIECIEDLVELSAKVNSGTYYEGKYIVLTKNLDFNSIFDYSNYQAKYKFDTSKNAYIKDETSETSIKELCTTESGFIPITNTGPASSSAFKGIFDGQGHTISNIYIDGKSTTYAKGLFGKTYNATIKNLTITGLVKGTTTGGTGIAGIAGSATSGYFTNCINKATIEGTDCNYTAGIISTGTSTVENCKNEGIIKGKSEANEYSVCGIGKATIINKCCNTGKVQGEGKARLFGIGHGTIKNSYNISDIGDNEIGAAVGISVWRCYKLL